jgi:hypothetical protein
MNILLGAKILPQGPKSDPRGRVKFYIWPNFDPGAQSSTPGAEVRPRRPKFGPKGKLGFYEGLHLMLMVLLERR